MKNLSEVKVTTELMKKVQECETVNELMELAKENDVELTREEAEESFDELKRHLTDEELDEVSGGTWFCWDNWCPDECKDKYVPCATLHQSERSK